MSQKLKPSKRGCRQLKRNPIKRSQRSASNHALIKRLIKATAPDWTKPTEKNPNE
jgi:hypothetical protein